LKQNSVNFNKYDADKVYQIIRKEKIPYNTLTKDSVINIILNYEKNIKYEAPEVKSENKVDFYNQKHKNKPRISNIIIII